MAEREAGQHRNPRCTADGGGNGRQVVTAVVDVADVAHAEIAEDDGLLFLQDAGQQQGLQHALDAVGLLAHVFQKQDAAGDVGHIGAAGQGRQNAEVAAPKDALQVHVPALEGGHADAVTAGGGALDEGIHGVDARYGFAELAVHHGAGETEPVAPCQQGQL